MSRAGFHIFERQPLARRAAVALATLAFLAGASTVARAQRLAVPAASTPGVRSGALRGMVWTPRTAAPGGGGVTRAHSGGQPAPPAPFTAGWRDGFVIQSAQGDFRLQIGLLIQADGRFESGDAAVTDTFLMRRVRPSLRGRIAGRFEFYVNPDFAGGAASVQDVYVDTIFGPALRVRAGKWKTPFGLERLHSSASLLFVERALPTAIAPNRDVGLQVLGDLAGGTVSYQAAVMNGVADGGSADADTTDSKDFGGRVLVRPFARQAADPWRGLGIGVAATYGRQSGAAALPTFRTASLQQPFFSYAGAAADGSRTRYSPQFFYHHRGFGAMGEYVHSRMPVRRGALLEEIAHEAWHVAAFYVLTGEEASAGGAVVAPRPGGSVGQGGWGALQMAARYHALTIDDRAFALNLATPGASRTVEVWTVGVNWILTPNVKYVLNFERSVFDDGVAGARPPENGIVFRTQLSF
jgi:phosphate-selective porin OprO and OprP